jgi:hypothetical protein
MIQSAINTSRSRICHPYAKSATLRNFNAKANSRNANVTLKVFIQPPDLGSFFNTDGNIANSVNGNAKAMAKPSIPIAGAMMDLPAASTSRVPMIGPVQENDTITKVKAINRMLMKPLVLPDLLLRAVDHELGRVISNAPKKDAANTTRTRKKIMFTTAFVLRALSAEAPKMSVTKSPNATYTMIMLSP